MGNLPFDEKIVFTVSVLMFVFLTVRYFNETDFEVSYISAVGATLSVLLLYLLFKLHVLESQPGMRMTVAPVRSASKKRRR